MVLFQQLYHRTVVFFAFTDGLLVKRGEDTVTHVQDILSAHFESISLSLFFFSFLFELDYFSELLSTKSSPGKALNREKPWTHVY